MNAFGSLLRFLAAFCILWCTTSGNLENPASCSSQPLLCPWLPKYQVTSPAEYFVEFEVQSGASFSIQVLRSWSPFGADRFYALATGGYYEQTQFFRVLPKFVVQWGVNGDPAIAQAWEHSNIPNDPMLLSNIRGTVSYAADAAVNDGSYPTCTAPYCAVNRTTQIYINYGNNSRLDAMDFAPFGQVVAGMNIVDSLYSGYGECADACDPRNATKCPGPDQGLIYTQGNAYLHQQFPLLSAVRAVRVTVPPPNDGPSISRPVIIGITVSAIVLMVVGVIIGVVQLRKRCTKVQHHIVGSDPSEA